MRVLWASPACWACAFIAPASASTPNRYHARLVFMGPLPCCSGRDSDRRLFRARSFPPPPLECPRSESNRHAFQGGGFSCHFGFRRPAGCALGFVVWSTPSP